MDFLRSQAYSGGVLCSNSHILVDHTFYAPSHRYRRLAYGSYGFGHTNVREPGDLRGTVVGRKGRYKLTVETGGES